MIKKLSETSGIEQQTISRREGLIIEPVIIKSLIFTHTSRKQAKPTHESQADLRAQALLTSLS